MAKRKTHLDRLLAAIEKKVPSTVGGLPRSKPGSAETAIHLGKGRGRPKDGVPHSLLQRNGRINFGGEELLVQEGCAYETEPIEWQILYPEGANTVLISKYAVDLRTGGPDLSAWLAKDFRDSAFSPEERVLLREDPRLISPAEIKNVENRDLFKLSVHDENEPRQWWINAMRGAMQQVVREDGTVYVIGYNIRIKKACVRPVIRVDTKALRDHLNH